MTTTKMPEPTRIPSKLEIGFLPFNSVDRWFTTGMAAVAVIAWHATNVLSLVLVVAIWGLLMARRDNGRVFFLVHMGVKGKWRMWVRHGVIPLPREGRARARSSSNDIRDSAAPFNVTERGGVGVISIPGVSADSYVFVGDGSDIASLSQDGQQVAHARIADTIKQLVAMQGGHSVGISFVFRLDPFDGFSLGTDLSGLLHPSAIIPSGWDTPDNELTAQDRREIVVAANWAELTEMCVEYGRTPWMATVVTIRRDGAALVGPRATTSSHNSSRVVGQIVAAVVTGLASSGVDNPRALDGQEIRSFLRGGWDLTRMNEYYEQVAEAPREGATVAYLPCVETRVTNSYSFADGTYSAVLRVKSTPDEVWQGFFRELIGRVRAPHFSVAQVGDSVRSDGQVRWLEGGVEILEGLGELAGRNRPSRRAQAREAGVSVRIDELFGSGYAHNYAHLIAVHAATEEDLENSVDLVVQGLMELRVGCARITGAEFQFPALWAATIGVGML